MTDTTIIGIEFTKVKGEVFNLDKTTFFEREHLVYDEELDCFSLLYVDEDCYLTPNKEYRFIRIDYNPNLDFEVENVGLEDFLKYLLSKQILENKLIKWNTSFPLHYPSVTYFTVKMHSSRDYYTDEYDFEYWLEEIFDQHFNKNKISE